MKQWHVWYRTEPDYDDKFKSYTRFGDALNFMKKLEASGKDIGLNNIEGPEDFIWQNRETGEQFEITGNDWQELPEWLKE